MYVRNYDYHPSCPIYKAEQALTTAILMIESHQKMLDRNSEVFATTSWTKRDEFSRFQG
jgi:hypothetical protein